MAPKRRSRQSKHRSNPGNKKASSSSKGKSEEHAHDQSSATPDLEKISNSSTMSGEHRNGRDEDVSSSAEGSNHAYVINADKGSSVRDPGGVREGQAAGAKQRPESTRSSSSSSSSSSSDQETGSNIPMITPMGNYLRGKPRSAAPEGESPTEARKSRNSQDRGTLGSQDQELRSSTDTITDADQGGRSRVEGMSEVLKRVKALEEANNIIAEKQQDRKNSLANGSRSDANGESRNQRHRSEHSLYNPDSVDDDVVSEVATRAIIQKLLKRIEVLEQHQQGISRGFPQPGADNSSESEGIPTTFRALQKRVWTLSSSLLEIRHPIKGARNATAAALDVSMGVLGMLRHRIQPRITQ